MDDQPVYDSQQTTFQTPPLWARLLRHSIGASRQQEFLDQSWIERLLRVTPRRYQADVALWILAQSPHYFIYQWSDLYAPTMSWREVVRLESERNARSRAEICQHLLKPFLTPEATVLDFGCGPGYLAREVSRHVRQVLAVDVSRGVIACAAALNDAPNLDYGVNPRDDLSTIPSVSVDLIYSVAVFQHLPKNRALPFLREFKRILKPGGTALIHTILEQPNRQGWEPDTLPRSQQRTALRLVLYREAEWGAIAREAGFQNPAIRPIREMATLNDDVGKEHLLVVQR